MEPIKILNPLATVQAQQSAPQSGTDVVNQASSQAIQQGLHDNSVQNVRQSIANQAQQAGQLAHNLLGATPFTSESVTNTIKQKQYMNYLIQAKQDYGTALANGDEQGMADASQRAQVFREAAGQDGIDISSVGQDKTYAQSTAARDVFNIRNHGVLLGGNADSGTMYNEIYQKARAAGMTESGADEYAYRKATDYRQRRMQMLNDELYTQGINPNNSINAYGIQILSAMRAEDPDSADVALQTFGVPLNEYTYEKKNQAADSALNRALQTLQAQTGSKMQVMDKQGEIQKFLAQLQANTQLSIADKNLQARQAMIAAGINPSTGKKTTGSETGFTKKQEPYYNKYAIALDKLIASNDRKASSEQIAKGEATEEDKQLAEDVVTALQEMEASGEFDVDSMKKFWSQASSATDDQREYKYKMKPLYR